MTGNVRQTPPEPTCGTLWVTSDNSPTRDGTGPQNAPEGTVDMNSIDKLREWANGLRGAWIDTKDNNIIFTTCDDMPPSIDCVSLREHVNAILDGIEREVEEVRDREYRNGREDAKGAVEFADRLCRASERREDVTLWGVDYTALPLDADGVPIHVGDAMEADNGTTFEVEHISLYQWGWRCVGEGTDRSGVTCTAHAIPDGCRHHHAPTVEDVLREYAQEMNENLGMYTGEAIDADEWRKADERTIAEYAAKLRLAGDE